MRAASGPKGRCIALAACGIFVIASLFMPSAKAGGTEPVRPGDFEQQSDHWIWNRKGERIRLTQTAQGEGFVELTSEDHDHRFRRHDDHVRVHQVGNLWRLWPPDIDGWNTSAGISVSPGEVLVFDGGTGQCHFPSFVPSTRNVLAYLGAGDIDPALMLGRTARQPIARSDDHGIDTDAALLVHEKETARSARLIPAHEDQDVPGNCGPMWLSIHLLPDEGGESILELFQWFDGYESWIPSAASSGMLDDLQAVLGQWHPRVLVEQVRFLESGVTPPDGLEALLARQHAVALAIYGGGSSRAGIIQKKIKALDSIRQHDYATAEEIYRALYETADIVPEHGWIDRWMAGFRIGQLQMQQEKFKEAANTLWDATLSSDGVINVGPRHPVWRTGVVMRAEALINLDRPGEAVDDLETALDYWKSFIEDIDVPPAELTNALVLVKGILISDYEEQIARGSLIQGNETPIGAMPAAYQRSAFNSPDGQWSWNSPDGTLQMTVTATASNHVELSDGHSIRFRVYEDHVREHLYGDIWHLWPGGGSWHGIAGLLLNEGDILVAQGDWRDCFLPTLSPSDRVELVYFGSATELDPILRIEHGGAADNTGANYYDDGGLGNDAMVQLPEGRDGPLVITPQARVVSGSRDPQRACGPFWISGHRLGETSFATLSGAIRDKPLPVAADQVRETVLDILGATHPAVALRDARYPGNQRVMESTFGSVLAAVGRYEPLGRQYEIQRAAWLHQVGRTREAVDLLQLLIGRVTTPDRMADWLDLRANFLLAVFQGKLNDIETIPTELNYLEEVLDGMERLAIDSIGPEFDISGWLGEGFIDKSDVMHEIGLRRMRMILPELASEEELSSEAQSPHRPPFSRCLEYAGQLSDQLLDCLDEMLSLEEKNLDEKADAANLILALLERFDDELRKCKWYKDNYSKEASLYRRAVYWLRLHTSGIDISRYLGNIVRCERTQPGISWKSYLDSSKIYIRTLMKEGKIEEASRFFRQLFREIRGRDDLGVTLINWMRSEWVRYSTRRPDGYRTIWDFLRSPEHMQGLERQLAFEEFSYDWLRKKFGGSHEDTRRMRRYVASTLGSLGRDNDGLQILMELLKVESEKWGACAPETLDTWEALEWPILLGRHSLPIPPDFKRENLRCRIEGMSTRHGAMDERTIRLKQEFIRKHLPESLPARQGWMAYLLDVREYVLNTHGSGSGSYQELDRMLAKALLVPEEWMGQVDSEADGAPSLPSVQSLIEGILEKSFSVVTSQAWLSGGRFREQLLRGLQDDRDLAWSLATREADAATVAFRESLLLKDAAGDISSEIRRLSATSMEPAVRELRDLYHANATETASLAQDQGEQVVERLNRLRAEREDLERRMGRALASQGRARQQATVSAVQAALGDQVLVDYRVYQDAADSTWRLAAVVVDRDRLSHHALGEWEPVADLIQEYRSAVSQRDGAALTAAAAALYRHLWASLTSRIPENAVIHISPDDSLHLFPFAALQNPETHRYLIQSHTIQMLGAARDLLRRPLGETSKRPVVAYAPTYSLGTDTISIDRSPERAAADDKSELSLVIAQTSTTDMPPIAQAPSLRTVDTTRSGLYFDHLPGALAEGKKITDLLSNLTPQPLVGAAATEAAIRAVSGPRFLHIATHGFYLGGDELPSEKGSRFAQIEPVLLDVESTSPPGSLTAAQQENPLLRSGLALAGANDGIRGEDEAEDGVLTALEAQSLDLVGTELVVLSACDTGVGEVRTGQGVVSLQRAFLEAGAGAVVYSLWKVDDEATQQLMTSLYGGLLSDGILPLERLRQVQLEMLSGDTHAAPWYWAAFTGASVTQPVVP